MKKTTASIQIRRARHADARAIASVLRQAFAEFEPLYTKRGYAATVLGADGIVARMDEGPVWIATWEGHLVGTAAAVRKRIVAHMDGEPGRIATCEGHLVGTAAVVWTRTDVYVRGVAAVPAARGFGIGRLLLKEAESFAKISRARRLFLTTTPFLFRAIQLYQAFGFRRTEEGPHDLFGTPLFTMEKLLTGISDK